MVDMETSMDNTLPPEVHLPSLPTLPSPAPTTFVSPCLSLSFRQQPTVGTYSIS